MKNTILGIVCVIVIGLIAVGILQGVQSTAVSIGKQLPKDDQKTPQTRTDA
jgi:hypothetical protein